MPSTASTSSSGTNTQNEPTTILPVGLGVHQLLDAQAVDLAHHEVEVAHALGAVLLGQEGVGVGLTEDAEQRVVLLEVEAQLGPHGSVVN